MENVNDEANVVSVIVAGPNPPIYASPSPDVRITMRATHIQYPIDSEDPKLLKLEILRLRDELIGALAREGEAQARLDGFLKNEADILQHRSIKNHQQVLSQKDELEEQIISILNSRTWRIGSILLKPTKPIRRLIAKRNR